MGGGGNNEGFERVFDLVGGHGRFQWRLLAIIALQLIVLTWHHISYAFMGNVPDHYCQVPDLQKSNWTLEQQKMISIPRESADPEDPDTPVFAKCDYYNLNYAKLIESSGSFEEAYDKIDWDNVTRTSCSKWNYDKSIYKSTIATEFNLVCGKRWMVATIQGSYMAGGLIGTLSLGAVSDRFLGRRRTVMLSLSFVVIGGIVAAFSTSYWMFLTIRFIIAIGVAGSMQNCFVLVTEHADKNYRALLALLEQLPFAIGYMILPGLAYFLREWNTLQLSFGLLSLGLIVYYWILPESPRWLATKGQTDRAIECLYKIAAVNRLPTPQREDLEEILKQCASEEGSQPSPVAITSSRTGLLGKVLRYLKGFAHNFAKLMKTGEIRKRSLVFWSMFTTVAMCYYGIVFSGNISSDPYFVVFLGGLMEVPAYTCVVPFVSRLGRKPTVAGTFFLTAYEGIRITLGSLAKLFVSSAFGIIYLLGAELYPTELRTTGLAVGVFSGRLGAISAPYIVDLMSNVYRDLPTIIFGVVAVGGGLVSLMLPETKTLDLSDKVTQIELQAQDEIKAKQEEKRRQSMASVQVNGGAA